jgi:predicted RNA-binding protein with RPS1 domain
MSNPKPEMFAKQTLWALAGIQAQLVEIESKLTVALSLKPSTIEKMTEESNQRRLERQKEIFNHLKKSVGLDEEQSGGSHEPRR